MKKQYKILFVFIIILVVSLIAYYYKQPWVLLLYNTVLALFPNEIKNIFYRIPNSNSIRLSYSYIFRIEVHGCYLLVKDEQGRNNYHPVGGVYKYDEESVDISERFEGVSDNLFNATADIQNDLRIIIKRNRLKQFRLWFSTQENRENINNLYREFFEELIKTGILPEPDFKQFKYKYIGSYTQKSYNEQLKMQQIRHFDVLNIKFTSVQKECLNQLMSQPSKKYLFARKQDICDGYMQFAGNRYDIAEYTKLILIGCSDLEEEFNVNNEYTAYNVCNKHHAIKP